MSPVLPLAANNAAGDWWRAAAAVLPIRQMTKKNMVAGWWRRSGDNRRHRVVAMMGRMMGECRWRCFGLVAISLVGDGDGDGYVDGGRRLCGDDVDCR